MWKIKFISYFSKFNKDVGKAIELNKILYINIERKKTYTPLSVIKTSKNCKLLDFVNGSKKGNYDNSKRITVT